MAKRPTNEQLREQTLKHAATGPEPGVGGSYTLVLVSRKAGASTFEMIRDKLILRAIANCDEDVLELRVYVEEVR